MSRQDLSEPVEQLLRRLETYEQLHVLLAVTKDAQRAWSADELQQQTRLSAEGLQDTLRLLTSAGLLEPVAGESRWTLAPSAHLQEAAAQLLTTYQDNVLVIVKALTDNALERVRTKALHTFADAFVVRGKDDA
jgi:hypothetical protein